MKQFNLMIEGRSFNFEYSNGYIWLIESKNSFTNFGQTMPINFYDAENFASIMLRAMGRIKKNKAF